MANRLALLLHRRSVVLLALSLVASLLGAVHGFNFGHGHGQGLGFWDGPL